ncbi:MAG: alpha-galactosidase [Myxococcota bacterium]
MTVQVQRDAGRLRVRTPQLRIEIDRATLRFDVTSLDGRLRLGGCRPSVLIDGRSHYARASLLDGVGEIRTRLGVATRVHLRATCGGGLNLLLDLEVADDWPGLILELAIENRGDAPLEIEALDPLCSSQDDGGRLELPGDARSLRFYRMGYQSWSPAGRLTLHERDARPRPGVVGRMHFGPWTPAARRGLHVSDWQASLAAPGEPGVTLGFLTHSRMLGHVALEHAETARRLYARCVAEGLPVAPGESLRAERLWLGLDADGSDGMARWAERAGREMNARVPQAVGSGWCSWYQYFTSVRAEDVRAELDRLRPYRGMLETVQIDDGFQSQVGDWLEPHESFPEGVAPLADEIRDAGFRAGLWLAPFLASRSSRLAREHPDWLLRDPSGKPIYALAHPSWPGRWMHALDPTHPGMLRWLDRLIRDVVGMGYDYLKLDFLFAGALRGGRYDPTLRTGEAYRLALATIREAAGRQAFLLGCGAPLGPSIGLVDGMRIGPDVAPKWSSRIGDALLGMHAAPAAVNSIRNVLARSALHQRLWLNDPDCILLRDSDTRLSLDEVQALAAAVAMSGGLVVASDDLTRVPPARAALLKRLLPPLRRTPEISRWSDGAPSELSMRFPDGAVLVLRINYEARPCAARFDPLDHGFAKPVHVYDLLADRDLGSHATRFETDKIPGHGARWLRLTLAEGAAHVVGSTLHASGGSFETARLRTQAGGAVALQLRLPGERIGCIRVAPPNAEPVPVHVRFADRLDLEVWPGVADSAGLVESQPMAD